MSDQEVDVTEDLDDTPSFLSASDDESSMKVHMLEM